MERIKKKSKCQINKKSGKTKESEQGYLKISLREVLQIVFYKVNVILK